MNKTINFSFGTLHLTDIYVFIDINENTTISHQDSNEIHTEVLNHFKKQKYVIIVDRKEDTQIDLKSYKLIDSKKAIGIAIVSSSEGIFDQLLKEQRLFKNSFAFFKTVDEAKNWAESFVDRYGS